jgi:hypothetical protein
MNDDAEVIRLEVDPEDAIKGAAAGNAAMDAYSKKADAAVRAASKAFDDHGSVVVRVSDRSRGSIERLVSALEKQAATYGKSGIEKLIAQRDQMIQRLGNEEAAVRRVTAAYEKMIASEKALEGSASGGGADHGNSGFRLNYAIRGVKDVAEGRPSFALAEAANILMALRGSALLIGGVIAGVAGAGVAAYEFKKHLDEAHDAAEKLSGQFSRFGDEQKLSNAEALVTNDRLQNAIAKIEHRPANGLKLAIDEASVAALKLSEHIDKSTESFHKLVKESEPGIFAKVFTNAGGFEDVAEMIGGRSGLGGQRREFYLATHRPAGFVGPGRDPDDVLLSQRAEVQKKLDEVNNIARKFGGEGMEGRREVLEARLSEIDEQRSGISLERKNATDNSRLQREESTAASRERAMEIEKRAREAFDTAYAGTQTPMQKYFGEIAKIATDRDDQLRTLPGQASAVNFSALLSSIAAQKRMLDGLKQDTERTDAELAATQGFGKGLTPEDPTGSLALSMLKRRFDETEKNLRSAGVLDARGGLSSSLIGEPTAPIPQGYVSPQQQLQNVRRQERGYLGLYGLRAGLAGLRPEQQAEGVYSARTDFADKEFAAQMRVADAITETQKRDEARVTALNDREEKRFEAQMEREQKLLEIDKQHFDQIKQASAGLYHTLFTSPRQFGGQLLGTLREAALHPVVDRLSTMTAQVLTPLFSPGGGGLSDIRLVGGAVPVHIVNAGPVSSFSSGGYFGGGGSVGSSATGLPDLPMAWTPAASAAYGDGGVMSNPLGSLAGLVGGPGGTSGFAGPVTFGGTAGRGGLLGGVFNGGGIGKGWAGMLSNLKDMSGFGSVFPRYRMDENGTPSFLGNYAEVGGQGFNVDTLGGKLNAFGHSPMGRQLIGGGLVMGGEHLAQMGLLGIDRGTFGGAVSGAVGGMAIGAGIGLMAGPAGMALGAGIGLGVGFLTGLGEMAAGVESQQHQAHRLIQSIYGVDLPERGGVIQQIVSMSQQFGGSIGMTVRTPQARQLIELYAMSTGQKNNLFLETPHAASLVQQDGRLFQGLSYFNGAGYNYASSLPTLGASAGTIPTYNPFGGAPIQLVANLSVDRGATGDYFDGRAVRVVSPAYVAQQNYSALQSGDRYRPAAAMLSPQTIFS